MENEDVYAAEINERFKLLPEDIKTLVYSADMEKVLRDIGTKHQLHVDQIGDLETETVSTMIGMSPTEDFASTIADTLEIDAQKGAEIAKDINEQLFVKIRESLKKMYEKSSQGNSGAITNPPYTPPPTTILGVVPIEKPPVPKKLELPMETHMALAQPTVSTPSISIAPSAGPSEQHATQVALDKEEAPKPTAYKAVDPYRELPE